MEQDHESIKETREHERKRNRFIGLVKKTARRANSWNRDTAVFIHGEDGSSKDSVKTTKIKFSQLVKAVLFQSSLVKTMQKKKTREKLFRPNSNLSTNSERSISPALSTSSSHEKLRSKSVDTIKVKHQSDYREYDWNYGLCLLLVSLFVMVLWGKAYAILCTTAWIFTVQHFAVGHSVPESVVVVPKLNSVEYKKRIIMEGLLERNHRRVL